MKVTPTGNHSLGFKAEGMMCYIHVNKREIWEVKPNKFAPEKVLIERKNIKLSMTEAEMKKYFEEIK